MKNNPYARVDKTIYALNHRYVVEFGIAKSQLRFDELHIFKLIKKLYKSLLRETKLYYISLARAEYRDLTDSVLSNLEIENLLKGVFTGFNPVTLYIFENEFDRKAQRLMEALMSNYSEKDILMDKHLKYIARQMSQGALDVRDTVVLKAYKELGIKKVQWVTAEDEKVCSHCNELDGEIFDISKVPIKPHYNCRCYLIPAKE